MDSTFGRPQLPQEARLDQFIACFEGLKDPRTGNAGLHDLHELLVIALCTVLSGGQGATHMAAFAAAKEPFRRGFLKLEMNKKQGLRWNRATVQPFLDVRTAVLNDTLEDVFRRRYPGFRPANSDEVIT